VLLTVWINAQGGLERIEIARSSGYPLLDQAALDAERKSRFRPAQLGQQPVPCKADALYCFQLE
jgi:protein TonB